MDTVEVHLTDSISAASATFFTLLGSLKEFLAEAAESVGRIRALRKELALFDEDVVRGCIQLLRKRRKRHNLQQLSDTVLQLKRVIDRVALCKSLVDEGEVERALDEIDAIELLMAGERNETSHDGMTQIQLRDIRGAKPLQRVVSDLSALRSRIGKIFEAKVHSLLIEDLQRHVQSVSSRDVLMRWEAASLRAKGAPTLENSAFPAYLNATDELRTALAPIISGLHRSRSIPTAIKAYREAVLRETRNVVQKPLSSSTEDGESGMSGSTASGGHDRTKQEASSSLTQNLRSLDAEDSETLLSTIYVGVAETLRRLKTQSGVLLDVACTVGNADADNSVKSPVTRSPTKSPPGNTLVFKAQEAVDVGHGKINKILQVRSEQTASLPLAHFLRYFTLNHFFAHECEAISGQTGVLWKTAVDGHIRGFIKVQRDREIQTLAQGMSSDNWQDKGFTARDTQMLEQVLECSTSDPAVWAEASKIWAPLSPDEAEEVDGKDVSGTNSTTNDSAGSAIIEEERFLLPFSAILCLRGVTRFLRLIARVPPMAPDISASLISYLRTFDSRCRQLVLGAGATRSARLKNITTKHLALASQALSFIATLVPYIREFVRRHAPAGPTAANPMAEFDRVRRAFQEHQDGICQKMVEIMESRARALSKRAREMDWAKEDAEGPRKYMLDLATDTGRLYKALRKYLPERTVVLVMVPVFTSYKYQLGRAFREADPRSEAGRGCMLRDVEHLVDTLGTVEGFGDMGAYLTKIIEGKEVERPPAEKEAE